MCLISPCPHTGPLAPQHSQVSPYNHIALGFRGSVTTGLLASTSMNYVDPQPPSSGPDFASQLLAAQRLSAQLCFPFLDHGIPYPQMHWSCLVFLPPSVDCLSWRPHHSSAPSGTTVMLLLPMSSVLAHLNINTFHSLEIEQVGACQITVPWEVIPGLGPEVCLSFLPSWTAD